MVGTDEYFNTLAEQILYQIEFDNFSAEENKETIVHALKKVFDNGDAIKWQIDCDKFYSKVQGLNVPTNSGSHREIILKKLISLEDHKKQLTTMINNLYKELYNSYLTLTKGVKDE